MRQWVFKNYFILTANVIDSKCHWQQMSLTANVVDNQFSPAHRLDWVWVVDKITHILQRTRGRQKKLLKTSGTISFFRKGDSFIFSDWKLSIENKQFLTTNCLLCSSPRNHPLLRVPWKLAHQVLSAIALYFYFLMLSHRMYIEY